MLLEKLIERQKQLGLNDAQFAKKLGVPRSTWRNTRIGERALGRKVALATMRTFSDLTADIVSFLVSDAPNGAEKVPNVA